MSSPNRILSTVTTTQIVNRRVENPPVGLVAPETPAAVLLRGERVETEMDRPDVRSLLQLNVTENSAIPAITDIEGIVPLDVSNFISMNESLSREQRSEFLGSIVTPDPSVVNPILSAVPYLTEGVDGANSTIVSILFADLRNERLLSFVNTFVQSNIAIVQPPTDLMYIINIWVYFNSSLGDRAAEFDLNFFVQELRAAFTQVYQYNFFERVRVDHSTTMSSIQESLVRGNGFADINGGIAGGTIENTRLETYNRIMELSTLANRRQFMATAGFSLINLLLVSQLGFNPRVLVTTLLPLMTPSLTPTVEPLPVPTNVTIRLRDIYDLALEKFHSFIQD
jgi:hypothetical protein